MRITIRSLNVLLLIAACASSVAAQDKPEQPAKPKVADLKVVEVDAKPQLSPEASWKKLTARKLEIFNTLQQLKKDFEKADAKDGKTKIRDQFVDLIREFQVDIEPQLVEQAPAAYAANANDLDAGEIVMQTAFNENQYEKSAEISAKLLAANYKSKAVLSTAAVSQYALHNFEDAAALLADAEKDNKLDPRYSPYVEAAKNYVDLWKTEKELRDKETKLEGDQALPRVALETSKGKIVIELFEDQAPNTVANFISLVEGKKYDGIKFHRVINGFMAQGGDPNTRNDNPLDDGQGGPGYSIKCECHQPNARMHFRGSLSMAHAGRDTGGSQFFLTHLPTAHLNPRSEPAPGGHTVFGRIIEGLEIGGALRKGDKIESAVVLRKRAHEYKPVVTADPGAEKEETKAEKEDDSKKPKDEPQKDETKKEDK